MRRVGEKLEPISLLELTKDRGTEILGRIVYI